MACAKKHTVDYGGQQKFYNGAKDKYRAGETVEFSFDMIATDTTYDFYVDGEYINAGYSDDRGMIVKFVMPDHDVKVELKTRNLMIEE